LLNERPQDAVSFLNDAADGAPWMARPGVLQELINAQINAGQFLSAHRTIEVLASLDAHLLLDTDSRANASRLALAKALEREGLLKTEYSTDTP
jgi:hypothetical protein